MTLSDFKIGDTVTVHKGTWDDHGPYKVVGFDGPFVLIDPSPHPGWPRRGKPHAAFYPDTLELIRQPEQPAGDIELVFKLIEELHG